MIGPISPPNNKTILVSLQLHKLMKKHREWDSHVWLFKKLLRIMKLTSYLILFFVVSVSASTYSQSTKLSLKVTEGSFSEVLKQIEDQSEFYFYYNNDEIAAIKSVSIDASNKNIQEILDELLTGSNLEYKIIDRYIVLAKKNAFIALEGLQQQKSVSGKVTDSTGAPIPGVSVVVKGSTNGNITDFNGKYILHSILEEAIIVYSMIGMQTQEIVVGTETTINVTLSETSYGLNEVVAIGYGTAKKRDIIGSIATINSEEIQSKSTSNFESNLQGLAAGVSVQSQSGVPGAPTTIKIRGMNSINSGTDPLWIVDGMPIISYSISQNNGTTDQSPMSMINSADIESVQILKDAAATAIYGSRASNGVIIITTKSGKRDGGNLSVEFSSGISDLSKKPEDIGFVNTQQYFQAMDEMYANSGKTFDMNEYYRLNPYAFDKLNRAKAEATNVDWYDQLFQKGSFTDFNISSSKREEKSNYFISANYRHDEGVQKFNSLDRLSTRANLEFNPIPYLKVGSRLNFVYTNNSRMQNTSYRGGTTSNGGLNAITTSSLPWTPIYNPENPRKYYNPYAGSNALAYADPANLTDDLKNYRAIGGIYADYQLPFLKELSLRTEASFDFLQSNDVFWKSREINLDASNSPNSFASDQAATYHSINYNLFATYLKSIDKHNVSAVGGVEAQRSKQFDRKMSGQNLIGAYQELGSPAKMLNMYAGMNGERYLLGYFGRFNYKYNDKYLFGFSVRRDGTSAFTEDYRWGTFLSFSGGWILTDEDFMNFAGERTFLKLRGSYGEIGNQNIRGGLDQTNYEGPYMIYGGQSIMGVNGTLPINVAVNNLTWETTKSTDLGIDYGFLDNRINGSVGWYNKYISGMLLEGPVPYSAGIGGDAYDQETNNIWGNIGDMTNNGLEFDIRSINISKNGFKWTTSFNVSFNKNEIKKLTPEADQTGKGLITEQTVSRKGYQRNEWYMAKYAGVDANTGVPMIYALDEDYYLETGETRPLKDTDGKDVLTPATKTNIRGNRFYHEGQSADPKYYGGLTNTFEYKGFDFSFLFTFSGGNYIYDYDEQLSTIAAPDKNFRSDILTNVWRKPGDIAKYPQLRYNNTYIIKGEEVSDFGDEWVYYDRTLYRGDYIKLKNIELGYRLPKQVLNNLHISSLRVYASATNLWTNTNYPGFDPEGAGFVYTATIPQLKSFNFGLNVKF